LNRGASNFINARRRGVSFLPAALIGAQSKFISQAIGETPESRDHVVKYFDPGDAQNLLNIHEQGEAAPRAGEIALTLRDIATKNDTTYRISQTVHETYNQPAILKGDLASDFVTYRFFFGFSHFRNSETFNVWPLFEKEILPFCVSTGGQVPLDMWQRIRHGNPNPLSSRGLGGTYAYEQFRQWTQDFAKVLPGIVDAISTQAQAFYDEHFAHGDAAKVTLKIGVTTEPSFTGANQGTARFTVPVIELGVQMDRKTVTRPQSFLNEAKLTQLALSVRFAASLVNLHESDLKLLVLDDLLVSLDMSNRMKIVEILLSSRFANYQKIILTHDLGFFEEFRRRIGSDHHQWMFAKLTGNPKDGPTLNGVKSDLEMAQDYLAHDQLAECGNRLRKAVEANLENFLNAARTAKGLAPLYDNEKFSSLASRIAEAMGLLELAAHHEFARLLQDQLTPGDLARLLSPSEIDPSTFAAANRAEKGRIIAKIIASKADIQTTIFEVLSDASRKRRNAIKLLNDVKNIKDRILNPASHAGVTPIYTKEAEDAVKVIQALEGALNAALATL